MSRINWNSIAETSFGGHAGETVLRGALHDCAARAGSCDCESEAYCGHYAAAAVLALIRIAEHDPDCCEACVELRRARGRVAAD